MAGTTIAPMRLLQQHARPVRLHGSMIEAPLPGVAVASESLRAEFDVVVDTVLATAALARPRSALRVGGRTGRDGVHTEAMGYVLAELQSVARAHPDATW